MLVVDASEKLKQLTFGKALSQSSSFVSPTRTRGGSSAGVDLTFLFGCSPPSTPQNQGRDGRWSENVDQNS